MVPWFREASEFLHQKGKFAYAHIDGEMKKLIPMFLETGIDVAEAFTPQPMTSVTTKEIREAWGDKVTLWGGIPSVMFEPSYSDQDFDDFVINLLLYRGNGGQHSVRRRLPPCEKGSGARRKVR